MAPNLFRLHSITVFPRDLSKGPSSLFSTLSPFLRYSNTTLYITTTFLMITSSTFLPNSLNFRKSLGLHNRAYLMFRHGCTTTSFNWILIRPRWFASLLNTTRKTCLSLSLWTWLEPRLIFLRNLGVTLNQNLSFQQYVSRTCQICYLELRRIRINSLRHYQSQDALKTLISAFVLSWIDCCNSLLAGCPE